MKYMESRQEFLAIERVDFELVYSVRTSAAPDLIEC